MMGPTPKPNVAAWLRALLLPFLLFSVLFGALVYALWSQIRGPEQYDQAALREWFGEARVFRSTLAQLVSEYRASPSGEERTRAEVVNKHLSSLGEMTRKHQGQLPLFPILFRLEVALPDSTDDTLHWDSHLPRRKGTMPWMDVPLMDGDKKVGTLKVCYQLHTYNKQQQAAQEEATLWRWLIAALGVIGLLAIAWLYFFLRRERARELRQLFAQHQVEHAEKLLLENEVRRQEAEHLKDEAERKLLEQRVATQEAEQKALEVKSQLYASIGIMAGSYAHNIKNLLVRPNDLIRRCLEANGLRTDQKHMLGEVGDTLHTVTERLQQILKTVRRDPARSELAPIDLNDVAQEIGRAWEDMARDKWKLALTVETCAEPLVIEADRSHLMQAVENLLFNARDATYEMRHRVREEARRDPPGPPFARGGGNGEERRREALIAAAAWKGAVAVRTVREQDRGVLEVIDNGIGMTAEVRQRCTETHFSTKRNSALFEGDTTGMGLGLSFVQTILDTHGGRMEIASEPLRGTTFRLHFPLATTAALTQRTTM